MLRHAPCGSVHFALNPALLLYAVESLCSKICLTLTLLFLCLVLPCSFARVANALSCSLCPLPNLLWLILRDRKARRTGQHSGLRRGGGGKRARTTRRSSSGSSNGGGGLPFTNVVTSRSITISHQRLTRRHHLVSSGVLQSIGKPTDFPCTSDINASICTITYGTPIFSLSSTNSLYCATRARSRASSGQSPETARINSAVRRAVWIAPALLCQG